MDLTPFFIEFEFNGTWTIAEVKPCCQENNVVLYDIAINNQFQYTITQVDQDNDKTRWTIALKNADRQFDPALVQFIGEQIEHHYVI